MDKKAGSYYKTWRRGEVQASEAEGSRALLSTSGELKQ
jgi:hypothetical protein